MIKRRVNNLPDASYLHETTQELTGNDAPIEQAAVGSALAPEDSENPLEEEVFPDDILPDDILEEEEASA